MVTTTSKRPAVIVSVGILAIALALIYSPRLIPKSLPSDAEIALFRKAAEEGDLRTVQRLLRTRSNSELVNHYEKFKDEPYTLQVAYSHHHLRIVRLLLAHGADVNATDDMRTPLLCKADIRLARMLIDYGADVDFMGTKGNPTNPPLIARCRDTGFVRMLLDAGANVNIRSPVDGESALGSAAINGSLSAMRLLLSRGADVNARDGHGDTPLHLAAGISADPGYERDDTPEHATAGNGYGPAAANVLIEHGANVDAANSAGDTPLHLAASAPKITTVQLLINKGARIDIRNKAGRTPLLAAVAEYSGPDGGLREDVMKFEIYFLRADVIRLLLQSGAAVGSRDNDGNTALTLAVLARVIWEGNHYKSDSGQRELLEDYDNIIATLISKGADINARNNKGETSLTIAAKYKSRRVVDYLRKHGVK
jgi:ankyrin repeat protein